MARMNIILEPVIVESEFDVCENLERCPNCGSTLFRVTTVNIPYNMSTAHDPEKKVDEITIEKNVLEMRLICAKCGCKGAYVTYYVEKKAEMTSKDLKFEEV